MTKQLMTRSVFYSVQAAKGRGVTEVARRTGGVAASAVLTAEEPCERGPGESVMLGFEAAASQLNAHR